MKKYASFWSGLPATSLGAHETAVFCVFPTLFVMSVATLAIGFIKVLIG